MINIIFLHNSKNMFQCRTIQRILCTLNSSYFCNSIVLPKSLHTMKPIYHHELESVMNKQINTEQHASQHYLAVASYFGRSDVSRQGCFNYFMSLHTDELRHAILLLRYQLLRGGNVILDTIDPPSILESTCIPEHFQQALELECNHIDRLENIIKVAQSYEDHHCIDFITTHLLRGQVASTRSLVTLIQTLKSFNSNHAMLYIFDKNLKKNYPLNNKINLFS